MPASPLCSVQRCKTLSSEGTTRGGAHTEGEGTVWVPSRLESSQQPRPRPWTCYWLVWPICACRCLAIPGATLSVQGPSSRRARPSGLSVIRIYDLRLRLRLRPSYRRDGVLAICLSVSPQLPEPYRRHGLTVANSNRGGPGMPTLATSMVRCHALHHLATCPTSQTKKTCCPTASCNQPHISHARPVAVLLCTYIHTHLCICTYIHVHKISLSRSVSYLHTDKACLSRLESRVPAIYPAAIAVALPTPMVLG